MNALLTLFRKHEGLDTQTLTKLQELINLVKGEHDINDLPDVLLELMVVLFQPDIACCYVREADKQYYRRAASFPDWFWQDGIIEGKFDRRPSKGGAMGKAVALKDIVLISDPKEAERRNEYIPVDSRVANEVVLPIVAQDSLVQPEGVPAVIILSRFADKEFSVEEVQLVKIVGSIISTAYNNSFAKEQREKRIEFLKTITESRPADFDTLYQSFFSALSRLVPVKFASMWLYNDLDDTLVIRSFYPQEVDKKKVGFELLDSRVLDCSKSLSGEVIKSKLPKVFTHLDASDKFSNPAFAKKHGLGWFISFPILDSDKKPLGVMNLWPDGNVEDFESAAIEILHSYTSLIASAIRLTSLLFEESLLFAYDEFFEKMLEFEDQKASWDKLAVSIRDQLKCGACSVFLLENDGLLHLKGSTGLVGNPPYEQVWYKPGEGLTGTAFQQTSPLVYYSEMRNEYTKAHISKFREPNKASSGKSKSIIIVQILDKRSACIGVIRCINKDETPARHAGRFTNEDVLQLQKIAQVISNIHSKVLWLREKERERETERERSLNSLHHEVLSPIDGLLLHVEWLERQFGKFPSEWDIDKIQLKIGDMKQNAKVVDMVVTTMGRLDEDIQLRITEFSVSDLLKTCRAFLINEANRRDIQIHIDYLGLPRIRGDALQLMRVFYNLLRNAIKYSDPNEAKRYVRISAAEERDYFVLCFMDNGIGIVPGEEESIFEVIQRGSNAAKVFPEGSGLGLAYCRSIMKKHGGLIIADPHQLAKPTTFKIKIPKRIRQ